MRRHDKKIWIEQSNKKFQQRCNESKFNWDGQYANEEVEESFTMGNDIETTDEDIDETTDVEASQWFSDEDGERITDKIFN